MMSRADDLLMLNQMAQTIYDKKGVNIIAIDVRHISSLTEYYIIASGNVDRHVVAIARAVIERQSLNGHRVWHVEGMQNGHWVVLDFGLIMVHILDPDFRDKFALESLWKKGDIVDLKLVLSKE
jgi:ribosome-associated protein